jgi:hypothetical protein
MAPTGQTPSQIPLYSQFLSAEIKALLSLMVSALAGQAFTHFPQPLHNRKSMIGTGQFASKVTIRFY